MSTHPFLGARVEIAGREDEHVFQSQLSLESVPFISDHLVYGSLIVPGAAYVDMAISAVTSTLGEGIYELVDFVIRQALALPEQGKIITQSVLRDLGAGNFSFQIFSRRHSVDTSNVNSWTLHASCHINRSAQTAKLQNALEGWKKSCVQEKSASEHFANCQSRGLPYGPSFRGVKKIWLGEGEGLSSLEAPVPIKETFMSYSFHPALLDACFQGLLFNLLRNPMGTSIYLPLGFERIRYFKKASENLWCHVNYRIAQNSSAIVGDLQVVDEAGDLILDIVGFGAVEASSKTLKRASGEAADVANWFYGIDWRQSSLPISNSINEKESWIIFADDGGGGSKLALKAKSSGHNPIVVFKGESNIQANAASAEGLLAFTVNPDSKSGFSDLFAKSEFQTISKSLGRIVYLWSLDQGRDVQDPSALQSQYENCLSFVYLTQAVQEFKTLGLKKYCVVTRGSQSVRANESSTKPSQSLVWGIAGAAAIEQPEMNFVRIDLDPKSGNISAELESLFQEVSRSEADGQIALREGARWVSKLVRLKSSESKNNISRQIVGDATYLVTGGLGALGLRTAAWLVDKGARSLVLVSRTPPAESVVSQIQQLEKRGATVKVFNADVSSFSDVTRVVSEIASKMPPLKGVIHAAGVAILTPLLEETSANFEKVVVGKTKGAWNLHQATRGMNLDFFVLYSSGASIIPAVGQGSYSAANAYLDSLSNFRSALGLPCLSVGWGVWDEIGMGVANNDQGQKRQWSKGGLTPFSPEEGLLALEKLLNFKVSYSAVLPMDWNVYAKSLIDGVNLSFLSDLVTSRESPGVTVSQIGTAPASDRSDFIKTLESVSEEKRLEIIQDFLKKEVAAILGYDGTTAIDSKAEFMTLGMDSLMAVEFRNKLKTILGASLSKPLPATLIFAHPTVEAVGKFLLQEVLTLSPVGKSA